MDKGEVLREIINKIIGNPKHQKYEYHIHQDITFKAMEKYAEQKQQEIISIIDEMIKENCGDSEEFGSGYECALQELKQKIGANNETSK